MAQHVIYGAGIACMLANIAQCVSHIRIVYGKYVRALPLHNADRWQANVSLGIAEPLAVHQSIQ